MDFNDSKSHIAQNFLALQFAPRLVPDRSEAEQIILERSTIEGLKDRAAVALGSTYLLDDGQPLRCQDGLYLSKHATVVVDGLGGHMDRDADSVRTSQRAAGLLLSSVIESAIRTQRKPADFLNAQAHELMKFVDLVSLATQFNVPAEQLMKSGDPEAQTAVVAVANCPDGLVAFGAGDCTALLSVKEGSGSKVIEFTPQPDAKSSRHVAGLGGGSFVATDATSRVIHLKPGVTRAMVVGSNGGLPKALRSEMRKQFAESLDGDSATTEKILEDLLGILVKNACTQRSTAIPLRDELQKTRKENESIDQTLRAGHKLTEVDKAKLKEIDRQSAGYQRAIDGLDDFSLGVRRLTGNKDQ